LLIFQLVTPILVAEAGFYTTLPPFVTCW